MNGLGGMDEVGGMGGQIVIPGVELEFDFPSLNLLETLVDDGRFTQLVSIIQVAGESVQQELIEHPRTLLAPTDDAINATYAGDRADELARIKAKGDVALDPYCIAQECSRQEEQVAYEQHSHKCKTKINFLDKLYPAFTIGGAQTAVQVSSRFTAFAHQVCIAYHLKVIVCHKLKLACGFARVPQPRG